MADGARIIGQVTMGPESSVWFGAVMRGDNGPIRIGNGSNVQDCAILHTPPGGSVALGAFASVGQQSIIHDCTIADRVLIDMQAVMMDGMELGEDTIVATGSVIPMHKIFPPGVLLLQGAPARVVRQLSSADIEYIERNALEYIERSRRYALQGPDLTQVAVASSMAIVLPTSISSARARALRRAVDWRVLARLAPGVLAGSLAGTCLAAFVSGNALLGIFLAFALVAIARMLAALGSPSAPESALPLPGAALLSLAGAGIGLLCALVGMGGGLLSVPLLAGCIPVRRAIGTTAALGLPLAATGAAGYMAADYSQACGSACLGYVYLPAVLVTSLAAVAAAPLGATPPHRWPALWLKRAFALLLAIVIADLALKLLQFASTIASRLRSGLLDPMECA